MCLRWLSTALRLHSQLPYKSARKGAPRALVNPAHRKFPFEECCTSWHAHGNFPARKIPK